MRQQITPELRQWIISQAQDGWDIDALMQAMTSAGWSSSVARAALQDVLSDTLSDVRPEPSPASEPEQPTGHVPGPDLSASPLYLDGGDRRVAVLARMDLPHVIVLGGLLSDEECDALIELARPRLSRSLTVATETGGEAMNPDRTSDGMFFEREETELVARIEARIARLLNWPLEYGEGLQVLCYGPGAEYKPHYDYFDPSDPGSASILARGGQRVGTLILYLNEPEQGGGTSFPDADFEVAPKRGNGVFFSYPQPDPSTRTLHGGEPVRVGEKWIATKWLRERRFV